MKNNHGSLSVSGSISLRADGHCDTVTALKNGKAKHIDLENIENFTDLQFFAIYIKNENDTNNAVQENEEYYSYYREILEKYEKIVPILSAKDINELKIGQVGSILAMENSEPLATDSEAIFRFIDKGYRSFGITWSNDNSFAGGANTDTGLKDLGRNLLRAMNKLPVLVDLAHMNKKSFFDSMEILEKPPIVTHGCCYSLCAHRRNLTDDAMKLLAGAKGLFGITFVDSFLKEGGNATIDRIVDHIIYAADIMGLKNVCLGSDFDGTDLPSDMCGQKDIGKLKEQMLKRDFSNDEIDDIMGNNLKNYLEKILEC
ncbi:MAG: membrane dipeptidase [Clostridiales bacterium]